MKKKKVKELKPNKKDLYLPLVFAKLTPRRKRFIHLYVTYRNASRAYREAYNSTSDAVARVQGHRLLTNVNIRKIIDSMITEEYKKLGVSRAAIVERMREFAFDGPRDKIAAMNLDMLSRATGIYQNPDEGNRDDEVDEESYVFVKVKQKKNANKG